MTSRCFVYSCPSFILMRRLIPLQAIYHRPYKSNLAYYEGREKQLELMTTVQTDRQAVWTDAGISGCPEGVYNEPTKRSRYTQLR